MWDVMVKGGYSRNKMYGNRNGHRAAWFRFDLKQGLAQGALLGHDGSVWAKSPGFALKGAEGAGLANNFKNPSGTQGTGIFINGEKYLVVKADDASIYGKKGTGGVITVKTGQVVLVGIYDDKLQAGRAANIVEKVADYLKENGY